MPSGKNQRLKLYYILEIFRRESDEDHPLTMSKILSELEMRGVTAERKGVYRDIAALEDLGYDIVKRRGSNCEYYLASREFEDVELRMLVDAVQSSRFITKRKSGQLIRKLEALTTVYGAERLNSRVFVTNRIKSSNESIYYIVDEIDSAINSDSQILFHYFNRNVRKERVFRHNGKPYCVSPWALIWDNENYYMIAYDSEDEKIKHYRVDKMTRIIPIGVKREGGKMFSGIDLAEYSQRFFGMFGGELTRVRLDCDVSLADAVFDKFGTSITPIPNKEGTRFTISVKVALSPVFLSWVFMFGGRIRIESPESAAEQLRDMASKFIEEKSI